MGTFQLGVRVRKCPKLAKANPQLAAAYSSTVINPGTGSDARDRDCAAVSIRRAFVNCASALSAGAKAPQAFP
jgi:hypothetical protein